MTCRAWARRAAAAAALLSLASCATAPPPRPTAPRTSPATGAAKPAPNEHAPATAPASSTYRLDGEPAFDIGLAVDRDTLTLRPVDEAILSWRSPDGGERSASLREAVRFRVSGAQVLVEPLGKPRAVPLTVLESRDTLWVGEETWVTRETPGIEFEGKHWRGRFKLFLSPRGRMTLASRVSLEHYLLGVVPGEIGALRDSLLEAGRAQAIAARSYSLFYRGRRGSEGFDLYATVEDQLYGPVEAEKPLATKCVGTTRGQASLFAGAPIRANYCSTCGGVTADVIEAWPTDARGYLVSIADRGDAGDWCAASPQYRWREEWSAAELATTIARWAPGQGVALPARGAGEIRDVSADARSRSGRVWRLRIETSTGTILVPAYVIRQVLRRPGTNGAILRSNLFKIGVRRDSSGRALAIVASGAGSGHGVGLCQTGALAMARAGVRADAILQHYYAGSEVKRVY
jgi:stage II sporulation protein D